MKRIRSTLPIGAAVLLLATVAAGPAALAQKKGGEVVVAQRGNPGALDCHFNATGIGRNIQMHYCESLISLDENSTPIPELSEAWEISADGLTVTFRLRHGVKFHNGKEMTSADVKASMERFKRVSLAKSTLAGVAEMQAPDPYTFVMKLSEPRPPLIDGMASPLAPLAIYPAELTQADGGKIEQVTTGPYMLTELKSDSHALLKRFEGYSANPNYKGRDGFGGRKTAYFDSVRFVFMPEVGAMVSALETGQVHVVDDIPIDTVKRLQSNADIKLYRLMPWAQNWVFINHSVAPTDNPKVREAIIAAINDEEVMEIVAPGNYQLNHSWVYPNNRHYPGDIGKEFYNQNNPEKAKKLLAEAGYKGEPIVMLASTNTPMSETYPQIIAEQLKRAGMNVKVEVNDHPTYTARYQKAEGWNLCGSGAGIEPFLGVFGFEPYVTGPNNFEHAKDTPEMLAAWRQINAAAKFEDRMVGVRQVAELLWTQQWMIKIGDYGLWQGTRANLDGFKPFRAPRMWDVWFK
jgi:peptide/nickel transport system substrate-binding protein